MTIRRADIKDLDEIRQLFYGTITTINTKDYNDEQIRTWASSFEKIDFWKKCIETQFFFVAEDNTLITGFASVTKKGLIDFLYTHKDFQCQGIASKLLDKIEETASTLLLTTIWSDVSITARPFFKKKGFTIENIYLKKLNEVEFENTIMIKKINTENVDK